MEAVSAFAAYQSAVSKQTANKKSQKGKKTQKAKDKQHVELPKSKPQKKVRNCEILFEKVF